MRQIPLDEEALERGLDEAGLPTPDTPAAVVRATPEELAARYGLELQHTHDDLGDLVFALVQSDNGRTFALERHIEEPGEGTTLALFMHDVVGERLDRVLNELGLSRGDLLWEIPADGVAELREVMARQMDGRRARRSSRKAKAFAVATYALVPAMVIAVGLVVASLTRSSSAPLKLNAFALLIALAAAAVALVKR